MDSRISRPTQADRRTPQDHIAPEYLRLCLDYDPATGRMTWMRRPLEHFDTLRGYARYNSTIAGTPAFTAKSKSGYLHGSLRVNGERFYLLAHRVAWALFFGEWPDAEVDHIDRDKENNRIANLRPASRNENAFNRNFRANVTGYAGVKRSGRGYSALIRINGKRTYLGTFDTAELAYDAYKSAAAKNFGAHADWLA